jgi:hypothetical protein
MASSPIALKSAFIWILLSQPSTVWVSLNTLSSRLSPITSKFFQKLTWPDSSQKQSTVWYQPVSYFSIAVIKHHLRKKEFIWAYGSTGRVHNGRKIYQQGAGMEVAGSWKIICSTTGVPEAQREAILEKSRERVVQEESKWPILKETMACLLFCVHFQIYPWFFRDSCNCSIVNHRQKVPYSHLHLHVCEHV